MLFSANWKISCLPPLAQQPALRITISVVRLSLPPGRHCPSSSLQSPYAVCFLLVLLFSLSVGCEKGREGKGAVELLYHICCCCFCARVLLGVSSGQLPRCGLVMVNCSAPQNPRIRTILWDSGLVFYQSSIDSKSISSRFLR